MPLMNNTKTYITGSVIFGFSIAHRKWLFQANRICFITQVHRGGKETALKIANAISGSMKRNPMADRVDGLAMARIAEINHV
jgi:hypothetical protein